VDSKAVKFGGIFSPDRIVNSLFSNHTHTTNINAISKIIEITLPMKSKARSIMRDIYPL
jgi:hypothetical protein